MSLNRRQFLGLAGSAAGTAATGGLIWKLGASDSGAGAEAVPSTTVPPTSRPATSVPTTTTPPTTVPSTTVPPPIEAAPRTLVLVQMSGGNDALNTLVPADGRYRDARPTLAIAEEDVIAPPGLSAFGLHPAMAPLMSLWDTDQLAIVAGLAVPGQSRSHFVALDTWWAASSEPTASGGWLGRWLDATRPETASPMRAVSLGGGAPALTGVASRPIIVQDLDGFALAAPGGSRKVVDAFTAMAEPLLADLFGEAQAAIPTAVSSVDTLRGVLDMAPERDVAYEVERLFHAAAAIIAADVGTEIVLINVRGFDTHSDQLDRHLALLGGVANGVAAMYELLADSGHAAQTATMGYSEFGRRVGENGSGGTDHGNGGLAFVAGPPVAGRQVVGDVDLGSLDDGDLRASIDTRSLYADVLDWLGGPTDDVLGGRFDSFALL